MGLNERQEKFKKMVDNKVVFHIRGYSLHAYGEEFPLQMAKRIGLRPKTDDPKRLMELWYRV